MKKPEKRVSKMERAGRARTKKERAAALDFAAALRGARLRAAAGNPCSQTVITREMMECPVNREFWRSMHEARERVPLLRK
jgi:hypothetical protein